MTGLLARLLSWASIWLPLEHDVVTLLSRESLVLIAYQTPLAHRS